MIHEYCAKWNLSSPVLLKQPTGRQIFRVKHKKRDAVLKILDFPIEEHGSWALQCFSGNGAVQLLRSDRNAQLMEYVDGDGLEADSGDEIATEVICEVLQKLHRYDGPIPAGLLNMRENFQALFLQAQKTPDSIYSRGVQVAKVLLNSETEPRLLHGDVHHGNIMKCSRRGWLAIDPKGLIGERAYDLANVFYNPERAPWIESHERVRNVVGIFSKKLEIQPRRILDYAFVFGCLSSAWCIADGTNPDQRLRIAGLLYEGLQDYC